jgi:hypothetical protein
MSRSISELVNCHSSALKGRDDPSGRSRLHLTRVDMVDSVSLPPWVQLDYCGPACHLRADLVLSARSAVGDHPGRSLWPRANELASGWAVIGTRSTTAPPCKRCAYGRQTGLPDALTRLSAMKRGGVVAEG